MGIERLSEFWPEWKAGEVLGKGSFGKVYKAENNEAGFSEYSAIKVISIPNDEAEIDALQSEGMSESDTREYFHDIVKDFVNEIKLLVSLKGAPNIVSVEGYKILEKQESIGWDIFIRMELLHSFKEILNDHIPTEPEVVKMGIDIANALEICQKENIIHRDIKPANIFFDKYGNFKLGDFGIAKELEKTTGAASSKGTYSFMAPEVAKGQRYNNTVDIYSLGLVMYTLLNGNRPPFVSANGRVTYNDRKEANDRRLAGEALPKIEGVSDTLNSIILTACAYDPEKRFKSATALKNALKAYMNQPKAPVVVKPAETKPVRDIEETVAVPHKGVSAEKPPQTVNEAKQLNNNPKPKKKGIIIAVALILVVAISIVTIVSVMNKKDDDTPEEPQVVNSEQEEFDTDYEIGDVISFGHYEQDDDDSNGKEEIEWIVLDKKDGKALVISKYALDCQPYNEEWEDITWEDCTLRAWLNDEFYNKAFSGSEKTQIETTYVVNDDNGEYGTEGGNDTSDKIFLLSIDEAEEYFDSDEARECAPTAYAESQGAYVYSSNGNCWWWLRSPGYITYNAAGVYYDGWVNDYGSNVSSSSYAVRPALWINLEN